MSPHELHLHWKNKPSDAGQMGGKMSIHDEQKIERLREQTEKLHSALRSTEQKLKEAMQLLSTACIVTNGDKHSLMWLQRRINLENKYYNYKD